DHFLVDFSLASLLRLYSSSFFFFACSGAHRDLPSFPTRRSSDLHRPHLVGCGRPQQRLSLGNRHLLALASPHLQLCLLIQPLHADRKSTRLNSSHVKISYAVFCLKKKKKNRVRCNMSHTADTTSV